MIFPLLFAAAGSTSVALGTAVTEEFLVGLGHPLQITPPPALRLGGFVLQVLLGVGLKGLAAAPGTEVVTAPLVGSHQVYLAGVQHHATQWINNKLGCSIFGSYQKSQVLKLGGGA